MFQLREIGDLKFLEISEFIDAGIKAYFTTRLGGVSRNNYTSLNLGLHTNDDSTLVLQNRRILAETLGFNYQEIVAGEQVHKAEVYHVQLEDKGKGALKYKDSIKQVDALITDIPRIPLLSFYADCVPLFFMEPQKKVIALAHAGWRGTYLKIGIKTITEMCQVYGIQAQNLWVAIGPCISCDYYQVDEELMKKFKTAFPNWKEFTLVKNKGNYNLNLVLANQIQIREAGVPLKQIIKSNYCTVTANDLFYSYRQEKGQTGRMASVIMI